ncbi:glycoside hydrolase family 16 protein [Nocardioides sp. SYSU DS0651]|uniref:glycoside hydrolase family 16 protein n=1 Tax=Nocardioides sp. SYSU DS0651 TaxID=3415955 RepID=UPI003F4B2C48
MEVQDEVAAAPARSRRRVWAVGLAGGALLLAVAVVIAVAVDRSPGPADACGEAVEKPGGGRWRCTFADDFDGDRLDEEKWRVPHGPPTGDRGTETCPVDDSRNVAVADGELRLTVTPVDGPVACEAVAAARYAGGTVSTYRLFSQKYGRFETRMRTAPVTAPGLHEAFWLWPDDRYPDPRGLAWPAAGEIDIAETYSLYPDLAVPFLHYGTDDNGGPVPGTNTAHCSARRGAWHTYTLEWTPDRITIEVDGDECLVNESGDPAFDKRYIVLLTAGLGRGQNAYRGGFDLPATLEVDYVRVWK